jgi:hypothetical protein
MQTEFRSLNTTEFVKFIGVSENEVEKGTCPAINKVITRAINCNIVSVNAGFTMGKQYEEILPPDTKEKTRGVAVTVTEKEKRNKNEINWNGSCPASWSV